MENNMENKIKWCAIQPLTGGMYIGAEQAIGHKAEFILSFPGLGDADKVDKETGEVLSAGNEYSLMKYLDKKNDRPDYRVFNRAMFQYDDDLDPEITESQWSLSSGPLDYSNMDLCVAVPVCSGLSRASFTMTNDERKKKNCNMLWITKYALNKIQPRCYIFENAPAMMNDAGTYVRKELEDIAREAGYSICYYKTNTLYHHNAQKRLRTFIMFFKQDDMNNMQTPQLGFEHNTIDINEYLAQIPADATQQYTLDPGPFNDLFCAYYKNKFGDNWIDVIKDITDYMTKNNLYEDIKTFTDGYDYDEKKKEQFKRFVDHVKDKTERGMGFYNFVFHRNIGNTSRAVMFKTIMTQMHPTELRLMTIREHLWLMGMPFDFEIQGDYRTEYRKIGQNVPVKTAKWVVEQALDGLTNPENKKENKLVRYFDNVTMKEQTYEVA